MEPPSALELKKDLILVHTVHHTLITNDKNTFSGRMVSSGISDVVIASVHFEKTRLKKLMKRIIIIIMNKS